MILNKKQDELYDLNKNLKEKVKEEIEKIKEFKKNYLKQTN